MQTTQLEWHKCRTCVQVHAYAAMAATKLLGRLPDAQRGALLATLQRCTAHIDVEVQQRACEVTQVLKLKTSMPVRKPHPSPPTPRGPSARDLPRLLAPAAIAAAACRFALRAGERRTSPSTSKRTMTCEWWAFFCCVGPVRSLMTWGYGIVVTAGCECVCSRS